MPRTVQLSEDAYASLAALKEEGESFSSVVKRLVRTRKNPRALLDLSGVRDGFDPEALRRLSRDRDVEELRRRGLYPSASRRPSARRRRG